MLTEQSIEQPSDEDISIEDLTAVLAICQRLQPRGRRRLIDTITTFFGVGNPPGFMDIRGFSTPSERPYSSPTPELPEKADLSAKDFILQKQPQTGVERVVCLAFYLTHYRDTPHFKTLDISKLNTEAAQPKFANAALTVNDATKSGYLISVTKGNKQLSAAGELFVHALPNREEARAAMASARPKRRRKASANKSGKEVVNGGDQ